MTVLCLRTSEKLFLDSNSLANMHSHDSRFLHKLDVPPALPKSPEETAVTYLNKGSQYSLLVEDTSATNSNSGRTLYCTSVQVAFDTESRRQKPVASWQLWDQSRGADEGHLFNGRFQAIEFVKSNNHESTNHMSNAQVVHSDGFSLVWSADSSIPRQCSIKFQLNFLSTDFSLVKGVHGATMQLCSKTEEICSNSLRFPSMRSEISFCRIKIFRSHGAERKTANDTETAAKRIAKLKQKLQLSKQQSHRKDTNHGNHIKDQPANSSDPSKRIRGLGKAQEDVLRVKLNNLQKLCTMTQKFSILDQRSEQQQHCDWYPRQRQNRQKETSAIQSSSSIPTTPILTVQSYGLTTPSPYSTEFTPSLISDNSQTPQRSTSRSITEDLRVACFYVQPTNTDRYSPIYLFERTALELTQKLATALSIDATTVVRTVWLCDKGFKIMVDDDVVVNMKEGQGIRVAVNVIGGGLSEFELEF